MEPTLVVSHPQQNSLSHWPSDYPMPLSGGLAAPSTGSATVLYLRQSPNGTQAISGLNMSPEATVPSQQQTVQTMAAYSAGASCQFTTAPFGQFYNAQQLPFPSATNLSSTASGQANVPTVFGRPSTQLVSGTLLLPIVRPTGESAQSQCPATPAKQLPGQTYQLCPLNSKSLPPSITSIRHESVHSHSSPGLSNLVPILGSRLSHGNSSHQTSGTLLRPNNGLVDNQCFSGPVPESSFAESIPSMAEVTQALAKSVTLRTPTPLSTPLVQGTLSENRSTPVLQTDQIGGACASRKVLSAEPYVATNTLSDFQQRLPGNMLGMDEPSSIDAHDSYDLTQSIDVVCELEARLDSVLQCHPELADESLEQGFSGSGVRPAKRAKTADCQPMSLDITENDLDDDDDIFSLMGLTGGTPSFTNKPESSPITNTGEQNSQERASLEDNGQKQRHNDLERLRRLELRYAFEQLLDAIPSTGNEQSAKVKANTPTPKIFILKEARSCIERLRRQQEQLIMTQKKLKETSAQLKERLQVLKKEQQGITTNKT